MNLANVVLAIAVGVEDEILARVLEAGDQRRSISEIALVVDHAQERQFRGHAIKDCACFVLASVVDDQHLEIVSDFADLRRNRAHYSLDSVLIVVRRKEGGK